MKYLSFIFIIIIPIWLFSQQPFNLEFSLPKIDPDDYVKRVWIDDVDENGEEEIWVNSAKNSGDNYIWRVISYDLSGNILSEYSEETPDSIKIKYCKTFSVESNMYAAVVFKEIENYYDCDCILEIRDLADFSVIDSIYIFQLEPYSGDYYDFSIEFIDHNITSQHDVFYIGYVLEDISAPTISEHHYSNLVKYQFNNEELIFLETIVEGGKDIINCDQNNNFISIDFDFDIEDDWYDTDYFIYTISNQTPASINLALEFIDSGLTLMTNNDLFYNDLGLIIRVTPTDENNSFLYCYSPDFSVVQWQILLNSDLHSYNQSSCLDVNSNSNYLIYFIYDYQNQQYTYYFEIRDRINGNLVTTQESNIVPDEICRSENGDVLFFEYEDEEINVYSFNQDILGAEENLPTHSDFNFSNYPNPFNPSTTISFNLKTEDVENIKIEIYNLKGQKIKTFSNQQITQPPNQQIVWNGVDENSKPVSSGIYLYSLIINGKPQASNKCLLLK